MKPCFFFPGTAVILAAASCGPTVYVVSGSGTTGAGAAGATTGASSSSGGGDGGAGGGTSSSSGSGACSAAWSEAPPATGTSAALQVKTSPAGDVFVMGMFVGTIDLGQGPIASAGTAESLYVAKLDCTGTILWGKGFGAPTVEGDTYAMAVDAGGAVLLTGVIDGPLDLGCGPLAGGGFVAKLDGSGACVWSKAFGESGDDGTSIAVDGAGHILVSGALAGTADFGGGPLTAPGSQAGGFVVELDTNGNYLWGQAIAATLTVAALDATGDVLLCGTANLGLDLGGGPLPAADTLFFAELDPTGGFVWNRGFASSGAVCYGVTADASGGLVAAGSYQQAGLDLGGGPLPAAQSATTTGGFIASFGPGGALRFGLGSGGDGSYAVPVGVAEDPAGEVLVAGSFTDTLTFGGAPLVSDAYGSAFLMKLAAAGTVVWSRQFGIGSSGADALATDVTVSASGAPIFTGQFYGSLDLGAGAPLHADGFSPFIAQLAP